MVHKMLQLRYSALENTVCIMDYFIEINKSPISGTLVNIPDMDVFWH